MANYIFEELFQSGKKNTRFKKISSNHVDIIKFGNKKILNINNKGLTVLAKQAFYDIAHFLRPNHLKQLTKILKDPEASNNDKYVAITLLKNANVASGGILPMCQDTGTAIVVGSKGEKIWTGGNDKKSISRGIYEAFQENNLRYSQLAAQNMYEEINTKTNLPAQIDIYSSESDIYEFLFIAKGGGSANKSFLYQATPSVIRNKELLNFLEPRIKNIGTAACPPYHLAVVIGGLSAEMTMKTLKLATCHYLDDLPIEGSKNGRAFRDLETESDLLKITQNLGVGAQFGGKYFCHDIRVIRLPRHGASLPIAIGVSCGADRQALGYISSEGLHLEQLEKNPAAYLPEINESELSSNTININLDKPITNTLQELSKLQIKTRVLISGTIIVARDIAHSKLKERLDKGQSLPDYFKKHPIYYAGPAKTPKNGYVTGSFGPTTAGRMDAYVDQFQAAGGSLIMIAKGNRSKIVRDACKKHGGFYLGSIGGPGAEIAQNNILSVECIEFPELGMEAIWKIEVKDFPAFIVIDDKGNDFFDNTL
mgnify:CR=1 FL=1